MPRGTKTGSIFFDETNERYIVRRRYTDNKGRKREKERYAYSPTEADRVMRKITREIEQELAGVAQPSRTRTFNDLVAHYRKHDLKPAEYVGETKISGYRSWNKYESRLKPLEQWFGSMSLTSITYDDVDAFKRRRLATYTSKGTPLTIASVDRELSLLKHLFFIALRERWIIEHPFHRGKPLIQTADETSRMKILTADEEAALYSACSDRRDHLRLIVLIAIETGLRQGEQRAIEMRDVDLTDRLITVRAVNSKTARRRLVPITDRLYRVLGPFIEKMTNVPQPGARIFDTGDPKRAFATACRIAGIEDLTWHDLRHTAITRMLHFYKLSEAEVMRISGHTNYKTFLRYVNIDRDIARRLRLQIDQAREALDRPPVPGNENVDEAPEFIN